MEHLASTERRGLWSTWMRFCLLIATVVGCGTSDAFIAGIPVGGQAGSVGLVAGGSSIIGASPASLPRQSPVTVPGNVGTGAGGSVAPPRSPASVDTPAMMPTATAGTPGSTGAQAGAQGGASGSVALPSGGSGSSGCRQAKYSLAIRLTGDMSWDGTIALMEGASKVYFWSKLTIDPGANVVSEYRTCGSLFPVLHGTALSGNAKGFQQVPLVTYERPTMPTLAGGSAMRVDSVLTLLPGALVVGLTLPDPAGPWPARSTDPTLMPVDADGDGKRGITQLVRNDGTFTGTPTSILQTERVDAVYVATRLAYRATLNDAACADTLEGTAELLAIDALILGCHVKDRDDCRAEELAFIEDNRLQFKYSASAVVHAVVIPVDAGCTQAVKVLEVPGP